MKGKLAPRILAVLLFVALLLAPAVFQEGLASFWAAWGLPLLAAAGVLAVLMALVFGPLALARRLSRRRDPEVVEDDSPADAKVEEESQSAGEDPPIKPDTALTDALGELQPENFMDLARALEEMGRDADTLEVLAQVIERKEQGSAGEVAEALRRLRLKLGPDNPSQA